MSPWAPNRPRGLSSFYGRFGRDPSRVMPHANMLNPENAVSHRPCDYLTCACLQASVMPMARQTHAKPEGEKVASVRLPAAMHDRLRSAAEAEYRTVSQELRRLVEQHLNDLERAA